MRMPTPGTTRPTRTRSSSDAGPASVTCAQSPCARALVTTVTVRAAYGGFCVLLGDGTVACWGQNRGGQLGRGADLDRGQRRRAEGRRAGERSPPRSHVRDRHGRSNLVLGNRAIHGTRKASSGNGFIGDPSNVPLEVTLPSD